MQLRLHCCETVLKPKLAAKVQVDPLTCKESTEIDKAQSAACALDAHETSFAAAARKKRECLLNELPLLLLSPSSSVCRLQTSWASLLLDVKIADA